MKYTLSAAFVYLAFAVSMIIQTYYLEYIGDYVGIIWTLLSLLFFAGIILAVSPLELSDKTRKIILISAAVACLALVLLIHIHSVYYRYLSVFHVISILLALLSFAGIILSVLPLKLSENTRKILLFSSAITFLLVALLMDFFVTWGEMIYGIFYFIAFVFLFLIVVFNPTDKPTPKGAWTEKFFFIPAILIFIGGMVYYWLMGWKEPSFIGLFLVHLVIAAGVFFLCRDLVSPYIKEREKKDVPFGYVGMIKHVLLLVFVDFIWRYIWIFKMTKYTNEYKGEAARSPVKKLLLCFFVPFYSYYWTYKTAQRIDRLAAENQMECNITEASTLLAIFVPIAAPILMQSKVNKLVTGNYNVFHSYRKYGELNSAGAGNANNFGSENANNFGADGNTQTINENDLLDEGIITEEEPENNNRL